MIQMDCMFNGNFFNSFLTFLATAACDLLKTQSIEYYFNIWGSN